MFRIILILVVILSVSAPQTSHAFGLLKYLGDMVSNQLGLDRGPIPKVIPKCRGEECDEYRSNIPKHVYTPSFHLQAEGF
jgi:hypothetical protein